MRSYLVESYAQGRVVDQQRQHARRTAELGTGVRYVRTTFLPEDETVLHVFEARSEETLRHAVELVGLQYDRIVEAVESSTQRVAEIYPEAAR
jgi:type VI protein secretion system component Hcp